MASFNSFATLGTLSGIHMNISSLYSGLGASSYDYNLYGHFNAVRDDASDFVDAYRDAAVVATFDPDTWTLEASDGSGVAALETARDNLRGSETNLVNKVTQDLIGDGTVANSWSTGELAKARSEGGIVGNLSANLQEQTRDLTTAVSSGVADIQDLYESDAALKSFFETTTAEITALENNVNNTREGVANAREGFAITTTGISGNNTGRIVADANNKSLTSTIYTNATGDRIQISDYFTSVDALVVDGNTLFDEISEYSISGSVYSHGFTESLGIYSEGLFEYNSFTDMILARDGTQVREDVALFAAAFGGVTHKINPSFKIHETDVFTDTTATFISNSDDSDFIALVVNGVDVINGGNLTGGETAVYTYTGGVQDSVQNFGSPQQAMDWVYAQFAL